jgi:hypothetical protein
MVRFSSTETRTDSAKELSLSIFATARVGIEPLVHARGLQKNKRVAASSAQGVDLAVTYHTDASDRMVAEVELAYDARRVQPAGVSDNLPAAALGGVLSGNGTIHGLRIVDADGKPFTLGLASGSNQFDPTGKRLVVKLKLTLHPDKGGQGPPATATFWGTEAKTIEIPVKLEDVPLSGITREK